MMTTTSICGIVIPGEKRGREIGYPTANVCVPDQKRKDCKEGTYFGEILIDDRYYKAAIFIPTECDIIEAHILDFEGNLYGQEICVKIKQKIRDNRRFKSVDALKVQIAKDIQVIYASKQ